MPVERKYNNHVEIHDLITTFTNLMKDYNADREINFYVETGTLSTRIRKVYH